jgi:predicted phage terminase large subunit-like protein
MRTSSDGYIILDVRRIRGGPEEVAELILNTARADGSEVKVSLPQDPGQAGKVQALWLTQLLAGFNVITSPESGSKIERANPVAAQVNAGNFSMLKGEWNATLIDEMSSFPSSTFMDQVDGLSRAFSEVLPDDLNVWLKLAQLAGKR